MTILRRTNYIIQNGYKAFLSRQFHCVSFSAAKQSPKTSPRVVAKLRGAAGTTRIQNKARTYKPEECLPPIALLQAGSKSGALPIDPHTAVQVLLRYQELAENPSMGWERTLCTEFNISPITLQILGGILNRCPGNGQRRLAKQVMLSASELGETTATFKLIEAAIHSKSLDLTSFTAPLQRLGILAKKEGNRQAMALLGKVLLTQQKEREALEWFRKASQGPAESLGFEGAREALVHEGRILLGWADKEGAATAFRKAALELDDPSAYFYLSKFEEPNSAQQQVYLLKAASSGIVEAWHDLGSIELARIDKQPAKPDSISDYGMAREWFQVAAADGFGLSMLNLALICKAAGELDSGLKWLDKAEQLPEVREQAKHLRAQWGNQSVNIP